MPVKSASLTDTSPVFRRYLIATGALLVAVALLWYLLETYAWQRAILFAIGLTIGGLLYRTAFGFTWAFRRLFVQRDSAGVQAIFVMLILATLAFAPLLAAGSVFGQSLAGAVAPIGVGVAAGSFIFGLGMQLGGACGSGTLVTVGGGSARLIVTLIAFCLGCFWASLHLEWWYMLPRFPGIALGQTSLGWPLAAILQVAVLMAGWLAVRRFLPGDGRAVYPGQGRLLVIAGVGLALLNVATLVVSGHPWTITWGFTLWGAKAARLAGWDPAGVWFWTGGFTERALAAPVLADETSIMNIGIVLGALILALLGRHMAPGWRMGWRPLAAAIIGGLLMGYGARIAFGCNIGAFFSGVASTSLHGWLWILCALAGTWIGVRLRPAFGLAN
jgi:uncharacterized membrane protein YedE/YeeE